jgi:DNA (cytosine-5)-methyltransferase 1
MPKNNKSTRCLKTVDLFAGCGGLSLGFSNAGFDIVAAYDNWGLAQTVYQKNFNHDSYLLDLSNVSGAVEHLLKYAPEVIIGGPPCQDFSIAGKRVESNRASLTVAFAEIIARTSPQIAVMENVYNIEKSKSLGLAKSIFAEAGYGITTRVINASLVGVPQMRKRFFLIAAKGFKDEVFGSALDNNLADHAMTVADYFGTEIDTEFYYAHPRSYERRAVFSVHEPSATIRRVNRPIPNNYVKHPADKVAVTEGVRVLTTLERSRIQTFPKNFIFCGSKSEQEHLIANAVPVKLAQYVAEQVLECYQSAQDFSKGVNSRG